MSKKYLNKTELIDYLVLNKNVLRETINPTAFDEEPYANLITPYSPLIAKTKNDSNFEYPSNNNFNYYLECKQLDISLCSVFQIIIGCFERKLKCFLGDIISNKMRDDGDECSKDFSWIERYTNRETVFDFIPLDKKISPSKTGLYDIASEDDVAKRKDALSTLKQISENKYTKTNGITKHYLSEHGYVPFYVAVLNLSIGKLIALLSILNPEDQNMFICKYKGGKEKRYSDEKILKYTKDFIRLVSIRNISNHYDTLIPYLINFINVPGRPTLKAFSDMVRELIENYRNSVTNNFEIPELKKLSIPVNPYSYENITKINNVVDLFQKS